MAAGRQGSHGAAEAALTNGAYSSSLLQGTFWGEHWLSISLNSLLGAHITLQSHAKVNL